MRILGIDYGDKTIGLAVSDALHITAQSLRQYQKKTEAKDRDFFENLVREYEIGEIVIGLPLRMDGTEGTRVEKTKKFARWLSTFIQLPVRFWDERLTTKQAEKILDEQKIKHKTKKNLTDQISAAIILSSYLEGRQYNDDSQNP